METLFCEQCGYSWESRVKNPKACPNCGSRNWEIEVVTFTESYRDKRWRPCRFGCDLRSCGNGILKNNDSLVKVPSQPFIGPDNPYIVICERDGEPCNARFVE